MKRLLPLVALVSCSSLPSTSSQGSRSRPPAYGLELQAYPAGVVLAGRVERSLAEDEVVSLRLGWNETDREDAGRHSNEEGGGYGAGVGYTRWLEPGRRGWFWGGQLDLWQLDIDWRRDPGVPGPGMGSTDVLVLQPAVQAGYSLAAGSGWRLDWTASLGAEVNIDTDGEDVGEGAILLIGLRLTAE